MNKSGKSRLLLVSIGLLILPAVLVLVLSKNIADSETKRAKRPQRDKPPAVNNQSQGGAVPAAGKSHTHREGLQPQVAEVPGTNLSLVDGGLQITEHARVQLRLSEEQSRAIEGHLSKLSKRIADLLIANAREDQEVLATVNSIFIKHALQLSEEEGSVEELMPGAKAYMIQPFSEGGNAAYEEFLNDLRATVGEDGEALAKEIRGMDQFFGFGGCEVVLVTDGSSVYYELRNPETHIFFGGGMRPFAAFNRQFGPIFE